MRRKHPLQHFLDRQGVSQRELAQALGVTRETVNRWVRRGTVPAGANLLGVLEFAQRFEPTVTAQELFPPQTQAPAHLEDAVSEGSLGGACPICGVAWDVSTEQLPLAVLHGDLADHPIGEVCESCARRLAAEFDAGPPETGRA